FSSEWEVRLDAKAIGWRRLTDFPFGSTVVKYCDKEPARPFLQPSVVTMNGVPSNCGERRNGADVMAALMARKDSKCSLVHKPPAKDKLRSARWWACFPLPLGISALRRRSVSGAAIVP
ncbi:hypothetical protein PLICRDRAFT_105798, partial [Plicaturopsis crispa FD-325 SS-3]